MTHPIVNYGHPALRQKGKPIDALTPAIQQLVAEIEHMGGRIDRVYMCPHAPWEGCGCRKPEPGLFFQAAREVPLDLSRSMMVGDALSDITAARSAGLPRQVLVRTGRGEAQAQLPEVASLQPLTICDTLTTALEYLLSIVIA